jgi:hypothetical protein
LRCSIKSMLVGFKREVATIVFAFVDS